jgi:hypothetical protein
MNEEEARQRAKERRGNYLGPFWKPLWCLLTSREQFKSVQNKCRIAAALEMAVAKCESKKIRSRESRYWEIWTIFGQTSLTPYEEPGLVEWVLMRRKKEFSFQEYQLTRAVGMGGTLPRGALRATVVSKNKHVGGPETELTVWVNSGVLQSDGVFVEDQGLERNSGVLQAQAARMAESFLAAIEKVGQEFVPSTHT